PDADRPAAPRLPWDLAVLVFLQMLPATLVAPAIRPLFAANHGGAEGPMHAFMAVNMVGAAVAAPLLAGWARRRGSARGALVWLCGADAVLLGAVTLPLPVHAVLALRTLEGAAHVGAATLLLARMSTVGRAMGQGRAMGLAGGALMMAVATGSALGGLFVGLSPAAPFWLGAVLAAAVGATVALRPSARLRVDEASVRRRLPRLPRALWPAVSLAFVARFTIGCLVVTFALFAHGVHALSDAAVGGLYALLTYPFALATYPAARLGERIPRACLMGGGAVVYAGAIAGLGFVGTAWLPVAMGVAGLASAAIFASILCDAGELAGAEGRSAAMGWVNAAGCLGMVAGPAVAGIASAVLRPEHGAAFAQRTVFLIAAGSVTVWLALSLRAIVARARASTPDPDAGAPELRPVRADR
ncbi:MAG TPA: MFS transporter, partial [Sandaracinaceae bacterium LLY-WYZ-13_1]|nr:MFS transporter [Sandaracinaceae bacterium LLY-WYZ-13_1]